MKHLFFLFVVFIPLAFACVNGNNNKANNIEMVTIDSLQVITADEFIEFWERFSKAFLQNDTLTLYSIMTENINVANYELNDDILEIAKISFQSDTTISKSQFVREFRQSLNPVYLRLFNQYDIQEAIKTKNYRCSESINRYNYFVKILYNDKNNFTTAFIMAYMMKSEFDGFIIPQVMLTFSKMNNEIKLNGIHSMVGGVDE